MGSDGGNTAELMKRFGIGPAAGQSSEDSGGTHAGTGIRGNQQGVSGIGKPGIGGMQGGIPGMGRMQGGIPGMGGMQGGMESGSGTEEENGMSKEEIIEIFKSLDVLDEKDKDAAVLAMGGPELLQLYYQYAGTSSDMGSGTQPGAGGILGGGQGRTPGAGGMLGGERSRMPNNMGRGRGSGNLMGMFGGGGRGGMPGMGGGMPGMGGGMPGMGGGIPGMGGNIPGMEEGSGTSQEQSMQILQQFQMIEAMSPNDKEQTLLAMGGQEFVQKYNEEIAPMMKQLGAGIGQGGLPGGGGAVHGTSGFFGGPGAGRGAGMIGPGTNRVGNMFGGQVDGGGMFGEQVPAGAGDLFGTGGQRGLGGLFGAGGNENRQSSGTRNRQRPIDPKTIEGLGNLSEEDKKAALEAMGNPELTQQVNQSQSSQRTEDYEPPDQPYEPIGDGMYQFHRRQPLQLPIHGGGTDSRPQNICMMPVTRKRRFGEKDLVRSKWYIFVLTLFLRYWNVFISFIVGHEQCRYIHVHVCHCFSVWNSRSVYLLLKES
jgi:hypothetical protein